MPFVLHKTTKTTILSNYLLKKYAAVHKRVASIIRQENNKHVDFV